MPRRPLNECRSCKGTWYPRGNDASPRCPRCGSRDVRVRPFDWAFAGGCLLAVALFCCCGGLAGSLLPRRDAVRPPATARPPDPVGRVVPAPGPVPEPAPGPKVSKDALRDEMREFLKSKGR